MCLYHPSHPLLRRYLLLACCQGDVYVTRLALPTERSHLVYQDEQLGVADECNTGPNHLNRSKCCVVSRNDTVRQLPRVTCQHLLKGKGFKLKDVHNNKVVDVCMYVLTFQFKYFRVKFIVLFARCRDPADQRAPNGFLFILSKVTICEYLGATLLIEI